MRDALVKPVNQARAREKDNEVDHHDGGENLDWPIALAGDGFCTLHQFGYRNDGGNGGVLDGDGQDGAERRQHAHHGLRQHHFAHPKGVMAPKTLMPDKLNA